MPEDRPQHAERIRISGNGGRALAIVPVLVAFLVGALMLPRAAAPETIPLPIVDQREIARAEQRDRELAAGAATTQLPGVVRALGSALREFNARQADDADEVTLSKLRTSLNATIQPALEAGDDKLLALRAAQVETFLTEVRRFEQTGQESEELKAIGGSFVRRLRFSGWCTAKNEILLTPAERRVAFEATWNGTLGLDGRPQLALSLDEMRVLYTLYLRLPHAPEKLRDQVEASRRVATDPKTCTELLSRERQATELWRLDKVRKLGAIDPSYPVEYAVGVAQFRSGQFPASADAFRAWLTKHPDGPWSLRARNHLKAAIDLGGY